MVAGPSVIYWIAGSSQGDGLPTAEAESLPKFRDLGEACQACGLPGQFDFEQINASLVENRARGVKLYQRDSEAPGGAMKDAFGRRFNYSVEYSNSAYGLPYIWVPFYVNKLTYPTEFNGEKREGLLYNPVCVPEDVLSRLYESNFERARRSKPPSAAVTEFLCDVANGLRQMLSGRLEAAKKYYDPNVELRIIGFETFPGRVVRPPVDWAEVARAARDVMAAVSERD